MLANILRCFMLFILCIRIIRGSPPPKHSQYSIRRTKSQEMFKYMNTTLDPCDDFFEYNCANFAKYYADDLLQKKEVSIMDLMYKEMGSKIKLELQTDNVDDGVAERKVKNFYKSCMKESKLTDTFSSKLKELIGEFGKMPVLEGDNWRESDFDWVNTVAEMNYKMHVTIIFSIIVGPDIVDSTIFRSGITRPVNLEKLKLLYVGTQSEGYMENYKWYIAKRLHNFLGVENQTALQTAGEIVNFERDLVHGLVDLQSTTPLTDIYVLTDTEVLQKKYLSVWDTKKLVTSGLGYLPSQVVIEIPYLENAFAVIQKTPKKVLANYIFYTYLSPFFETFSETLAGQDEICLQSTKNYFVKNLENMMFRKYFTEDDKQSIYVMWDEFKSSFAEVLNSPRLSWLQEATRKEAFAKLKNIKFDVNSYEAEDFDRQLSAIDIDEFDYIQNIHSVLLLQGNEERAKTNKTKVEANPLILSTTPSYLPQQNTVKIPVYFLQPYRIFSHSYPWAFNYAGIGFLIAHELIHGFDDTSSNYDANGNMRNWWDPESTRTFQDRIKCLRDQYKKYTYGGYTLPERTKQSENIADNGAVRLAYQAYLKWYEKASQMKQKMEWFPGMDYSYKQLFFISFAQSWCAAIDPSSIAVKLEGDSHTPDKFRVIGSLSNFDEFSREFNCPHGSGMNPIEKCEIY